MAIEQQVKAIEDFYERISIPVNEEWEENDFEFVNPLHVAQFFAASTGLASYHGQQAEDLTKRIKNLELSRAVKEREVAKIRRVILADNFSKVRASFGSEVLDAFVVAEADEAQKRRLLDLEREIEGLADQIGREAIKLDVVRWRLKMLEKNQDAGKQFLDYAKLEKRIRALSEGTHV